MKNKFSNKSKKSLSFSGVDETFNTYNIIYLVHGHEHFLKESYFSLLSLFSHNIKKKFKLHIYTDRPDFFQNFNHLNVNFIELDERKIKSWKGVHQFNHRLKIKVLIDICNKFPNGKYMFLDSDTYVTSPLNSLLESIKPNQFIMDYDEGPLTQKKRTHIKNLYEFLVKNEDFGIKLNPELHMWNSGVIGFDYLNHNILDNVLKTTDLLTQHINSHILEQFAFAYHFQNNGKVKNSSDVIHHYWYFKEMRKLINVFIQENQNKRLDGQLKNVLKLNPQHIGIEKWNYKRGSFWSKLLFRLTHLRKWKPVLNHS